MYCKHCGALMADDAIFCAQCGKATNDSQPLNDLGKPQSFYQEPSSNPEFQQSKKIIGVAFALFGLIGLLIGIALYPSGTIARQTFIKGWLTTFFIFLGIFILLFVVLIIVAFNSTPTYRY